MPRQPIDVFNTINSHIPEGHPSKAALEPIRHSMSYRAPEQIFLFWHDISNWVSYFFGKIPPRELNGWQLKVCKCVTDCESMTDEEWLQKITQPRTYTGQVPRS